MTISAAKKEATKNLSSNNAALRAHGIAYSEIVAAALKDASPRLSEEALLDKHARIKMLEYRTNYYSTTDTAWAHKAKACGDFLQKMLSPKETNEILKNFPPGTSFETIKAALSSSPFYRKLNPETLASAISARARA